MDHDNGVRLHGDWLYHYEGHAGGVLEPDSCRARIGSSKQLASNAGCTVIGSPKRCWSRNGGGVTMILPGKTEAGPAGMQPCRGIAWSAHRDDASQRDNQSFALPFPHRIDRPQCLENPRPKDGMLTLMENARSPFHAEPGSARLIRCSKGEVGLRGSL